MSVQMNMNPIVLLGPGSARIPASVITGIAYETPVAGSVVRLQRLQFVANVPFAEFPIMPATLDAYSCRGTHLPVVFPTPIVNHGGFRCVVPSSGILYVFY